VKVLWIIHYEVFAGPHNRALRLHGHLSRMGVETTVVVPDYPGSAAERLRAGGVEVLQQPLARVRATSQLGPHLHLARSYRQDVARLRGTIRAVGADVVVVGGLVNTQGAVAANLEHAALVWQIIDTRTPLPVRAAMMPLVNRLADLAMFGAASLVAYHPGADRLSVPVMISRPAVDTELFIPSREHRTASRRALGIPENVPVVGTVANVNPQKGIDDFARAAGDVIRERPDTVFMVVGDRDANHPEYQARVDAEFDRASVPAEQRIFTGARADVHRFYPAMDVKVISSIPNSEGTTTTAMEAMACGIPVVATDVGGIREVVRDGETGILAPPLDPSALAERVLTLIGDGSLAERFGTAGRRRAESHHGLAAASARQFESYRAAVSHRNGRG
jgi:glycosyltransferase involved in cell wall biosynthesis